MIRLCSHADESDLRDTPSAFRTAIATARRGWRYGSIKVTLPTGQTVMIQGNEPGPNATLIVRDTRFVKRVLAGADIGFGEGYVAGEWDTPDLAALLEAFTANFDQLEALVTGNPLVSALNAISHAFNRNSKKGSRRNIHAHYDLGNAFYAAWLDPSMTYSSALFAGPGTPLTGGQDAKYAAMADAVGLKPGERVLEIGCGWGGFAEYAVRERGAHVTGLTISKEQADFAKRRLFEAGLADRASIQLVDYRDSRGLYDKVVSIEMFEAVGEHYWPTFFQKVRESLPPGGRAALQVITIRDELFKTYRQRSDFMRKYIFPGGMLPSEARLKEETSRVGFEWRTPHRFGQDYARTLEDWASRFEKAWTEIATLGFDERFRRLWIFYLRYCQAAFRTERTNVIQVALTAA